MLIIQICAAVTVGLFEPWLLTSKTRYTVYIYIYNLSLLHLRSKELPGLHLYICGPS